MAVRFNKNPVIEAVFEFAPRGGRWIDQTQRQIEQEVSIPYTGKQEDVVPGITFGFQLGPAGAQVKIADPPPSRRRIWTSDEHRMVQFSSDLCAFNALKPYTHYKDYLPAIESLVTTYSRRTKASAVKFLGQRYINEILLPNAEADPADYFVVYPKMSGLQTKHPPFAVQLQVDQIVQGQTVLSLAFKGFDAAQRPRYLLDLYARTPDDPPMAFDWVDVRAWQDQAHESITKAFQGALQKQCDELLGKEGA